MEWNHIRDLSYRSKIRSKIITFGGSISQWALILIVNVKSAASYSSANILLIARGLVLVESIIDPQRKKNEHLKLATEQ